MRLIPQIISIYASYGTAATGDIIVEHNVEAGRLIAGGNVMIKKGSCSKYDCFIDAKGEVSGSFFEAANINAEGNVKANYIMNSNIFGGRTCKILFHCSSSIVNSFKIISLFSANAACFFV